MQADKLFELWFLIAHTIQLKNGILLSLCYNYYHGVYHIVVQMICIMVTVKKCTN